MYLAQQDRKVESKIIILPDKGVFLVVSLIIRLLVYSNKRARAQTLFTFNIGVGWRILDSIGALIYIGLSHWSPQRESGWSIPESLYTEYGTGCLVPNPSRQPHQPSPS